MVGEGGSFELSHSQPDWVYADRAMLSYARDLAAQALETTRVTVDDFI